MLTFLFHCIFTTNSSKFSLSESEIDLRIHQKFTSSIICALWYHFSVDSSNYNLITLVGIWSNLLGNIFPWIAALSNS